MSKWLAGLAAIALLAPAAWVGTAAAADQDVSPRVSHARTHHVAVRECGCCGCWYPEYVRHRDVVYHYPDDPRFTLTSEPYYMPGRVHRYIHNWF